MSKHSFNRNYIILFCLKIYSFQQSCIYCRINKHFVPNLFLFYEENSYLFLCFSSIPIFLFCWDPCPLDTLPLSKNTWLSKTHVFLLTLVILLLPESILVICFIHWHTEYLPSLAIAWYEGFVSMSQNRSGIASLDHIEMIPNYLSWSIFQILSWLL